MKRLRLAADEVAIPITLNFSDRWGHVLKDAGLDIDVPEFTPETEVGLAIFGEPDEDPANHRPIVDVQLPTPYENSPVEGR